MQITAILIGLVLLAAIAFYVSRPILQPQRAGADTTTLATLDARRDAVYSQIRELDMDHATGKMNDDDYQQSRADLVAQAATLLKQIDGVLAIPIAPAADVEALIAARRTAVKPAPARSEGDEVEAAIAARRTLSDSRRAPPAAKTVEAELESAIAARRRTSSDSRRAPPAACPTCGKPVTLDDAFCAKCGTPLTTVAR